MEPTSAPRSELTYLEPSAGVRIAYCRTLAAANEKGPGIVFLGGFMSDMTGTKALALEAHAAKRGRAFLRFDYQGHGASSGLFEAGCIGLWTADALTAIDALTEGPQILVGSSMGGWIALKVALTRPERVAGLVGIAAAPDFIQAMWDSFDAATRTAIVETGRVELPSDYGDEPYVISRVLIEDGRHQALLQAALPIHCPVRLLHGTADKSVPWKTALRIMEKLESGDVEVILIKDGDHRLSEPADLARLYTQIDRFYSPEA